MRFLQCLFTAVSFAAQPMTACEIALVLAVDVSGSVDTVEFRTQMDGLAQALRDGAISEALVAKRAAIQVIQWTGRGRQRVSVPWTHIRGFDDTDRLATEIAGDQRVWRNFSTAIGEALLYARDSFDEVPECRRRVIDVSGDGRSNEGVEPREVHAQMAAAGIIVNGLAIEESDQGLTAYYEGDLITGPGSFAMRAADFEEYPDRIKRKLLREVTKQVASGPIYDRLVKANGDL